MVEMIEPLVQESVSLKSASKGVYFPGLEAILEDRPTLSSPFEIY